MSLPYARTQYTFPIFTDKINYGTGYTFTNVPEFFSTCINNQGTTFYIQVHVVFSSFIRGPGNLRLYTVYECIVRGSNVYLFEIFIR